MAFAIKELKFAPKKLKFALKELKYAPKEMKFAPNLKMLLDFYLPQKKCNLHQKN